MGEALEQKKQEQEYESFEKFRAEKEAQEQFMAAAARQNAETRLEFERRQISRNERKKKWFDMKNKELSAKLKISKAHTALQMLVSSSKERLRAMRQGLSKEDIAEINSEAPEILEQNAAAAGDSMKDAGMMKQVAENLEETSLGESKAPRQP